MAEIMPPYQGRVPEESDTGTTGSRTQDPARTHDDQVPASNIMEPRKLVRVPQSPSSFFLDVSDNQEPPTAPQPSPDQPSSPGPLEAASQGGPGTTPREEERQLLYACPFLTRTNQPTESSPPEHLALEPAKDLSRPLAHRLRASHSLP